MMNTACNICGHTEFLDFGKGRVFYKCAGCGHIFSTAYLKGDIGPDSYGKDYFFGGKNGEYSDYLADKRAIRKNFDMRINVLDRFIDQKRHKRLLEIGCAYGLFLEMAVKRFDSAMGMDITREGVRYAKEIMGLDAVDSDFLEYDLKGRKFDVVCMWDTIEHLMDPARYLEKIRDHMDSGGLVAITTGDMGSLNASIRKDRWRLMNSPTHIHFFSRKSLAELLDAKGFDVVYGGYCGFVRSFDMLFYRMFKGRQKLLWLENLLRKSRLADAFFYLNLYDIMYVIARKR